MPYSEVVARDGRQRQIGERVADEVDLDSMAAVEVDFKREDDQHARDVLLDALDAALLPCPQLRTDEVDDRDVEGMQGFSEAQVDVREVDEDGYVRALASQAGFEPAELGVDFRHVANDFGDAHVGDVFRADNAAKAEGFHAKAAESEAVGIGIETMDGFDKLRTVMFAAGFTR